jgi:hypothetical protein
MQVFSASVLCANGLCIIVICNNFAVPEHRGICQDDAVIDPPLIRKEFLGLFAAACNRAAI